MASTLSHQYTEMSCLSIVGSPHTAKRNAHPSVLFLPTLRTFGGVGHSLLVTFFSLGRPYTTVFQLSRLSPIGFLLQLAPIPPLKCWHFSGLNPGSSSPFILCPWWLHWFTAFYPDSFSEHHTKSGYPADQLQIVHVQDGTSHLCPKWISLPFVLSQ